MTSFGGVDIPLQGAHAQQWYPELTKLTLFFWRKVDWWSTKNPPKKVWLSCLESLHWLRDLDDLAADIGDGGISGFVASSWPVAFVRNVGFRDGNVGPPYSLAPGKVTWDDACWTARLKDKSRCFWYLEALHLCVKISQNCGVSMPELWWVSSLENSCADETYIWKRQKSTLFWKRCFFFNQGGGGGWLHV